MSTQKYLFIFTCFISGAAIMVIELSGIRLLAPIFGNSIYTWTALIGVVLVAFSVGGYAGGYLADKTTSPNVVVTILVASAVFIIVVPTIHAISNQSMHRLGFVYGPTILSVLLFLIPGSLLGAINPYATRLLSKLSDDKKIGAATGAANMASALGSFIGTYMAGFYLVPYMDVRNIFMLTAFVLVVVGAMILISTGMQMSKRRVAAYGCMLLVAVAISTGLRLSYGPGVIEVTNSKYQQIMIYEEDIDGVPSRLMINNGQPQGGVRTDTMKSILEFQSYWKIVKRYKQTIDTALMVGGGTFSVPQDIQDTYPSANITVLEIDEDVTDVAMQYFNMDQYPTIKVVTSDARLYSNNDKTLYDFIFVDAYNGNYSLPSHLATVEYFETLKERLAPDGLIMVNLIGNEAGPMSTVFGAVYNTFGSIFGDVNVYRTKPAKENHKATNLIMLASVNGSLPVETYPVSSVVRSYLDTLVPKSNIKVSTSPIVTDYKNPLDAISSSMLIENHM